MNIYSTSTLSNSFFIETSPLTSAHENLYETSLFSTTTEQFYHDYQYNPTPIPILNYPEYSSNNYNLSSYQPSSSLIPLQEQTVSTIKIHVNPFFRLHSSNRTNELSSEIKQEQQNNPSLEIKQQQRNSSLSSRSRSRSPSIHRQVIKSSNKKRQTRRNRALRREKFRKEKELIFKRQSSTKSKQHSSSPYRWEHKEEKLERLYKEYSNEYAFKEWKPLLLKDCFELYEYAFKKYYPTSNDD